MPCQPRRSVAAPSPSPMPSACRSAAAWRRPWRRSRAAPSVAAISSSSARSDRGRAHQPDARRFHRQCEPRAAHPARLVARLHRDAARHRQGGSGARERFLPIMGEQASRMTRLIDALLSLSRVEMNAHVPPSGLVDLNEVLNSTRTRSSRWPRDGLPARGRRLPAAGDRPRRPGRAGPGAPESGAERLQIRRAWRQGADRGEAHPRMGARPAATPSP